MLFISGITIIGVYAAAKIVEGVMMRAALEGEAKHFWGLLKNDPEHALPNTDNLVGYLRRNGQNDEIPEALVSLEPGYGRVKMGSKEPLIYVQQRNADTLYLVFDEESVTSLSFYFGVVPLSLALIILYISAWFAYRQSRVAVSPLVQLSKIMRQFNIETKSLDKLDLGELRTSPGNFEVNVLIESLNGFIFRINELVERERRFTRDASHELRTPLTVIQGSAEWLLSTGSVNDQQKKNVERILRTVTDMNELVNTLLMLARGEEKDLAYEPTNVGAAIRKILKGLEISHNAEQRIKVNVVDDGPLLVKCQPQGLEMVLGNLFRNAFNYTDSGVVEVHITPKGVAIANQKQGVDPGDLAHLFEPYRRGTDTANITGTGLGLDLVKRLCELFNWSISANYSVSKGMTFEILFQPDH